MSRKHRSKENIIPLDERYQYTRVKRNSSANGRSLLVFFVPGNPGTLEFVSDFLDRLHQTFVQLGPYQNYSHIGVHAINHFNHHLREESENELDSNFDSKDYEFQQNHQKDFVEFVVKDQIKKVVDENLVEIILIGHSIGCHMALNMLQKSPVLTRRTTNLISLMPFIFYSNLPRIHRLQLDLFLLLDPLSSWLTNLLAGLFLRFTTFESRELLLQLFTPFDDMYRTLVSRRFLSKRIISNHFSMGTSELRAVFSEESRVRTGLLELDRDKRIRLIDIHTDNDVWAPKADFEALVKLLPNNAPNLRFIPGLRHAFTVSNKAVRLVCDIIEEIVGEKDHKTAVASNVFDIDDYVVISESGSEYALRQKVSFSAKFLLGFVPAAMFLIPALSTKLS